MRLSKISSEIIQTTKFFLLTLFFSPAANPAYLILMVAAFFLTCVGELKPQDIFFLMFILSLSTSRIGDFFKTSSNEIASFMRLLPLTLRSILKRLFTASTLFSMTAQLILLILLIFSLRIPKVGDPHITFQQVDSNEIVSVLEGYKTDLSGRLNIPIRIEIRPSIIFGIVKKVPGYDTPFTAVILVYVTFVLCMVYFTMLKIVDSCTGSDVIQSRLNNVIRFLYFLIGLVTFCDIILPSGTIWNLRVYWIEKNQWIIIGYVVGFISLIVFAVQRLLRRISKLTLTVS